MLTYVLYNWQALLFMSIIIGLEYRYCKLSTTIPNIGDFSKNRFKYKGFLGCAFGNQSCKTLLWCRSKAQIYCLLSPNIVKMSGFFSPIYRLFPLILLIGSPDCDKIFEVDFEHLELGSYQHAFWREDWRNPAWEMGLADMVEIVGGKSEGKSMQVKYPAGRHCLSKHGPNGALWYLSLGQAYDELYLSFRFKFKENFEWVKGGKFHGFQWGKYNLAGVKPQGTDGGYFSNMWRPNGELVCYIYHPDQTSIWGDDLVYTHEDGTTFRAESGRWYTITNRIVMNTPGKHNGIVQTWIDEELVLNRSNMRFRDVDTLGIDQMSISTFFGGCDDSWAPSSNQYIWFDDFQLSLQKP